MQKEKLTKTELEFINAIGEFINVKRNFFNSLASTYSGDNEFLVFDLKNQYNAFCAVETQIELLIEQLLLKRSSPAIEQSNCEEKMSRKKGKDKSAQA